MRVLRYFITPASPMSSSASEPTMARPKRSGRRSTTTRITAAGMRSKNNGEHSGSGLKSALHDETVEENLSAVLSPDADPPVGIAAGHVHFQCGPVLHGQSRPGAFGKPDHHAAPERVRGPIVRIEVVLRDDPAETASPSEAWPDGRVA